MTRIITGKEIVISMNGTLRQETVLLEEWGCTPTLTIVRVGDRSKSAAYQTGATRHCDKIGIAIQSLILPKDSILSEVPEVIEALNQSPSVRGVLLLRPFSVRLDDRVTRDAPYCERGVDGATSLSLYGIFTGVQRGFSSYTARACIDILDCYGVSLRSKRAVVVSASLVTGRPVAMIPLVCGAIAALCHIDTIDLPSECHRAELTIAVAGTRTLLNQDCPSPGQVILNVGVIVGPNGHLYGDADFETANTAVEAFIPVPGGIGTIITTILAKHVIETARRTFPQ